MEIENPKTYEELEEIGFDEKQINQLLKAYEGNIDLELVVTPDLYSAEILRMARRCARPHHNAADLHILLTAIRDGCDLSFLEDKLYGLSGSGIVGIIEGVKYGYSDIKDYTGHQLSHCQLKYVVQGMDKALPLKYFYNRDYTPREIKFIVDNLDKEHFLKLMLDKKIKIQTAMKLMDTPELIKFCDSSTIPEMVDAYKELFQTLSKINGIDTEEIDEDAKDDWTQRYEDTKIKFGNLIKGASTPRQVKLVAEAIRLGLDYEKVRADYRFPAKKMSIFLTALKDGVDMSPVFKGYLENDQLDCIRSIYTVMQRNKVYKDFDIEMLLDTPRPTNDMRLKFTLYKKLVDLKKPIDANKIIKEESIKSAGIIYVNLKNDDLFTKIDIYKKYGLNDEKETDTRNEKER